MTASVTGRAGTASSPGVREVELSIQGMTCAACAARGRKKLSGLDGVTAEANFATGAGTDAARVGYLRRRVSAPQLLMHASGGGIYLEVAASMTTFLLAGRWYEARARRDAGDAMRELAAAGARQASVSRIQRLADRSCGVFVPVVLAAAGLTLAGWLAAGTPAGRAVSAALAVLIIACPCALGLATPAALVVACGRGAQLGIFIKGYQALEASRSVDTVVLDKTGTVTTGKMAVTGVQPAPGTSREVLLRRLGGVEDASGHPVGAAVNAAARAELGSLPLADGFVSLPGLGAHGVVDGVEVTAGRVRLFRDRRITVPLELAGQCAAADLGMTLGTGTVAISAADLILPRDDLGVIPDAIRLARATLATIRRNLAWAFGYNIAAMAASSAFVVPSIRLRRFTAAGPPGRPAAPGENPPRAHGGQLPRTAPKTADGTEDYEEGLPCRG